MLPLKSSALVDRMDAPRPVCFQLTGFRKYKRDNRYRYLSFQNCNGAIFKRSSPFSSFLEGYAQILFTSAPALRLVRC